MSYFKVHVNNPKMKPWMVEMVFGRELWPGYHTNWDSIVKNKEWITYNSEANGTSLNCVSDRNGRSGYGKDLTSEVTRLIGRPAPVQKYTDKQLQMMRDYRRSCLALPEMIRNLKRAHQERHMLIAELERQLGSDFDKIVRQEMGDWGK